MEQLTSAKPQTDIGANPIQPSLIDRLLALARQYHKEGSIRQATEIYWTLAESHPDQPQGIASRVELLALAEGYERHGARHSARSIYDRLMYLEQ